MDAHTRDAIATVLGAPVQRSRPLAGGDINRAYALTLSDGREVFAKTNDDPPPGMFAAEARGLEWLKEAGAIRVPAVLAADDRFLILELVRPGARGPGFDEELGRALAQLHRTPVPTFGLDHDNFIGRLPQANRPHARWCDFYRDQRLLPQVRRATDSGAMSARARRGLERVLTEIDALIGPHEPPHRLHGDLWSGNLMCDQEGQPWLIDPAVYGGHREVDLAMMRLFGGIGARTFAAYEEMFPLTDGHARRVHLYQLYPLLVHVNLFGGSYMDAVDAAVARLS
jgi:fructosamine-3-kinase